MPLENILKECKSFKFTLRQKKYFKRIITEIEEEFKKSCRDEYARGWKDCESDVTNKKYDEMLRDYDLK